MITASLQAQETGPLMMKQELGYTLGGGVFGSGLGVLVWFMDPLPAEIPRSTTTRTADAAVRSPAATDRMESSAEALGAWDALSSSECP